MCNRSIRFVKLELEDYSYLLDASAETAGQVLQDLLLAMSDFRYKSQYKVNEEAVDEVREFMARRDKKISECRKRNTANRRAR